MHRDLCAGLVLLDWFRRIDATQKMEMMVMMELGGTWKVSSRLDLHREEKRGLIWKVKVEMIRNLDRSRLFPDHIIHVYYANFMFISFFCIPISLVLWLLLLSSLSGCLFIYSKMWKESVDLSGGLLVKPSPPDFGYYFPWPFSDFLALCCLR